MPRVRMTTPQTLVTSPTAHTLQSTSAQRLPDAGTLPATQEGCGMTTKTEEATHTDVSVRGGEITMTVQR
jgi:hypothetical protein